MWLLYLILGIAALYLFKVNPLLCVVLVAVVLFIKFRGFRRKNPGKDSRLVELESTLVLLLRRLFEREEGSRAMSTPVSQNAPPRGARVHQFGGLFRE
jgi:hypothetical protein